MGIRPCARAIRPSAWREAPMRVFRAEPVRTPAVGHEGRTAAGGCAIARQKSSMAPTLHCATDADRRAGPSIAVIALLHCIHTLAPLIGIGGNR